MSLNHNLLIKFNYITLILSKIYDFFNLYSLDKLRILIYHHIESDQFDLFENQLDYIKKKNWKFITPKEFEKHILGKKKLKGKNVLLTFDDGLNSNFLIANKILKKLNIKAIFFVPSDFVKIRSARQARIFMKKNILDQKLPKDFKYTRNMSFKDLKQLIDSKHQIGAHSKTHANLGFISNQKILNNEILQSAKFLERKLKIKINHFAFTYGNFQSMSQKSIEIAQSKFKFIYSSLRGNNFKNDKNEIIKRDSIYLKEGNNLVSIFLSGIIDLKYFFQVLKINKIIKKN
ncbi:MAG: polysaccharide deacetylase [Rickettsiales bacterium]|nr:polysaccharide deacetylase [Rickettsiales bacterium]